MAQGPVNWMLNHQPKSEPTVKDPAFSLTKVLAAVATVLTPLAAVLASELGTIDFSEGNVVALILGVLVFLAIASTADVMARSVAAAATVKAEAVVAVARAEAERARDEAETARREAAGPRAPSPGYRGMLTLEPPMPGRLTREACKTLKVHALAEVDGAPRFLCSVKGDKQARWLSRDDVTFSVPGQPTPERAHANGGAPAEGPRQGSSGSTRRAFRARQA